MSLHSSLALHHKHTHTHFSISIYYNQYIGAIFWFSRLDFIESYLILEPYISALISHRRQRNIAITSLCIKVPLPQFNRPASTLYTLDFNSQPRRYIYIVMYKTVSIFHVVFRFCPWAKESANIPKKSHQRNIFGCSEIPLKCICCIDMFSQAFCHFHMRPSSLSFRSIHSFEQTANSSNAWGWAKIFRSNLSS